MDTIHAAARRSSRGEDHLSRDIPKAERYVTRKEAVSLALLILLLAASFIIPSIQSTGEVPPAATTTRSIAYEPGSAIFTDSGGLTAGFQFVTAPLSVVPKDTMTVFITSLDNNGNNTATVVSITDSIQNLYVFQGRQKRTSTCFAGPIFCTFDMEIWTVFSVAGTSFCCTSSRITVTFNDTSVSVGLSLSEYQNVFSIGSVAGTFGDSATSGSFPITVPTNAGWIVGGTSYSNLTLACPLVIPSPGSGLTQRVFGGAGCSGFQFETDIEDAGPLASATFTYSTSWAALGANAQFVMLAINLIPQLDVSENQFFQSGTKTVTVAAGAFSTSVTVAFPVGFASVPNAVTIWIAQAPLSPVFSFTTIVFESGTPNTWTLMPNANTEFLGNANNRFFTGAGAQGGGFNYLYGTLNVNLIAPSTVSTNANLQVDWAVCSTAVGGGLVNVSGSWNNSTIAVRFGNQAANTLLSSLGTTLPASMKSQNRCIRLSGNNGNSGSPQFGQISLSLAAPVGNIWQPSSSAVTKTQFILTLVYSPPPGAIVNVLIGWSAYACASRGVTC